MSMEAEKKQDPRKLALYRCKTFNCNESVDRWQCCHFCESAKSCEAKCQNDPKKCQQIFLGESVKYLMNEYIKPKKV